MDGVHSVSGRGLSCIPACIKVKCNVTGFPNSVLGLKNILSGQVQGIVGCLLFNCKINFVCSSIKQS